MTLSAPPENSQVADSKRDRYVRFVILVFWLVRREFSRAGARTRGLPLCRPSGAAPVVIVVLSQRFRAGLGYVGPAGPRRVCVVTERAHCIQGLKGQEPNCRFFAAWRRGLA